MDLPQWALKTVREMPAVSSNYGHYRVFEIGSAGTACKGKGFSFNRFGLK
jgi:hypothetical protein